MVTASDIRWMMTRAMPALGIRQVRLATSQSKKIWPDCWTDGKKITVTKEWARQSMHERRKRLTHELAHLRGLEHGQVGNLNYSTYPAQDSFSRALYRSISANPTPREDVTRRKYLLRELEKRVREGKIPVRYLSGAMYIDTEELENILSRYKNPVRSLRKDTANPTQVLTVTPHARARMVEKKVSVLQLKQAFSQGRFIDWKMGARPGRKIWEGNNGVMVSMEGKRVITVFWRNPNAIS